jgi:hypothetical protein
MTTRAGAALAAMAFAALALSACETTQQESAKIGRQLGKQTADAGTTGIGTVNRYVQVVRTALVAGTPAAVALELRNTSGTAQAQIPVGVAVRDAKGAIVYRNDVKGIESSIQEMTLLPAHATAWWVDNEVLASGGLASSVTAAVGAARGSAPAVAPSVTFASVSASDSFPGPHVEATVHNGAGPALTQLTLYAVATSAGKVVGAGRAIVPSLPSAGSEGIEIPMTGAVTGASIALTSAPAS